ncbi:hypothetical protein C8F01DRAFT_1147196 [Mycena amicta]|nr:hypothetical protein C8F01DRAFT_1147196 [Mycena amicta]
MANHLTIQVSIHGDNDRRCEVLLKKDIPEQVQDNLMLLDGWAQKSVMAIGLDMKHSQRWLCEICGEPAREAVFDPRPNLHLENPSVLLDIHHLCGARGGPCHIAVQERVRQRALAAGTLPPPSVDVQSKESNQKIPLASSCAKCQRDETGAPGTSMNKCSRCKLTRYCSVQCQTQDWTRHGKTCKMIHEVQWFNWKDNTPKPNDDSEVTSRMPGAFV